ncbi:hypothetical protein BpHYR1_012391 [Brachionus plicatilis]|uniref:Uncharacterized protein n=1 Tax=Brachionus plicatilis TaxID=10195 RepID=A0A3M7R7E9_BRAPC|nr:hypothetical protein BpHYR1_012391 [Brachionus plicatilis]
MTQSCPNISLTQFKKPIRDCYLMMHDNRPDCCILNCLNKEKNSLKLIRLKIYINFPRSLISSINVKKAKVIKLF